CCAFNDCLDLSIFETIDTYSPCCIDLTSLVLNIYPSSIFRQGRANRLKLVNNFINNLWDYSIRAFTYALIYYIEDGVKVALLEVCKLWVVVRSINELRFKLRIFTFFDEVNVFIRVCLKIQNRELFILGFWFVTEEEVKKVEFVPRQPDVILRANNTVRRPDAFSPDLCHFSMAIVGDDPAANFDVHLSSSLRPTC